MCVSFVTHIPPYRCLRRKTEVGAVGVNGMFNSDTLAPEEKILASRFQKKRRKRHIAKAPILPTKIPLRRLLLLLQKLLLCCSLIVVSPKAVNSVYILLGNLLLLQKAPVFVQEERQWI